MAKDKHAKIPYSGVSMSRIEKVVVCILFVGACIYADVTSRRIKTLEQNTAGLEYLSKDPKVPDGLARQLIWLEKRTKDLEENSVLIQQLQDATGDLQQRMGKCEGTNCGKCCCGKKQSVAARPSCGCCADCDCPKDGCKCGAGKPCGASGCNCVL